MENPFLETRKQIGIVKNGRNDVRIHKTRHQGSLYQTEQDTAQRSRKFLTRKHVMPLHLPHEFFGAHEGAGKHSWKEQQVKAKIPYTGKGQGMPAFEVCQIPDGVECYERQPYRRHQAFDGGGKNPSGSRFRQRKTVGKIVDGRQSAAPQGVPQLSKEHVVFEQNEDAEVQQHPDEQPVAAACVGTSSDDFADAVVEEHRQQEHEHEQSACFVAEEKAAHKKKGVPCPAVLIPERKSAQNKAEKNPERDSGKQKTVLWRKREEIQQ